MFNVLNSVTRYMPQETTINTQMMIYINFYFSTFTNPQLVCVTQKKVIVT